MLLDSLVSENTVLLIMDVVGLLNFEDQVFYILIMSVLLDMTENMCALYFWHCLERKSWNRIADNCGW